MVVAPSPTPVANPPLDMVAAEVSEDDQVTLEVMFWVVRSEYRPVAVNCWVSPAAMEATAGVTLMLTNSAGRTVKAAVPEMRPDVAVMVVAPSPTPVANPPLEVVAAEVSEDDQVTLEVMFWVVRSE